jgi:3-dehydroquinate synthase
VITATTHPPDDTLRIRSGQGDYAVVFVDDQADILRRVEAYPDRAVLIDRNVARLYSRLHESLAATAPTLLLDATEETKTWEGVGHVLTFLQSANATKRTVVVAVGGGVIQDIATFASHVYYRGVAWVYVPTTVLAMADSSIGAKCGINLGAFKNQVGVFQSPSEVLTWLPFAGTLAPDDVRSGYGEILKLHLTGVASLFDALASDLDREGIVVGASITRHVRDSLSVKREVIEEDEYERDLRRILNYGHTFGHALEAVTNHGIAHGLAVAWGVDVANFVSMRLGMLPEPEYARIHALVEAHFAATIDGAGVRGADLVRAMHRDKKASAGKANFILTEGPGQLRIRSLPLDAVLEGFIDDYLGQSRVLRWR